MRASRAGPGPSGNVVITGGTGVALSVSAGGIPFVGLSTGSVSAAGVISAITALPAVYPDAYCYFPANKLATSGAGSAAGFYYCTFTTTTAGTAFLNQYTSGKPTIPTSPTAVTNGQGAFTGDTGEEFGLTLTIPAMTATSAIRFALSEQGTSNANSKLVNVRLSGNAGTVMLTHTCTSTNNFGFVGQISNTGSAAKQISQILSTGYGTSPAGMGVLNTVDLSLGTATLVFSITRATATDNFVFLPATVEVIQ